MQRSRFKVSGCEVYTSGFRCYAKPNAVIALTYLFHGNYTATPFVKSPDSIPIPTPCMPGFHFSFHSNSGWILQLSITKDFRAWGPSSYLIP